MFDELKAFGLSDNEITTYITLLKTGTSTANRIAKLSEIRRSTTYDSLNALVRKGLAAQFTKEKVLFFKAAEPNKIVELLDQRRQRIQKIIPELEQMQGQDKEQSGVVFFEGMKGVITALQDILDSGNDFLWFGSRKKAQKTLSFYPDNFTQKRIEKKISTKAILAEEDKNQKIIKEHKYRQFSKIKFSKRLNGIKTVVFIYGDKVTFLNCTDNPSAIIIRNKALVEHQKRIFANLETNTKQ